MEMHGSPVLETEKPDPAQKYATGPRWYTLYGRSVSSDILLPVPPSTPDNEAPTWVFRYRGTVNDAPEPDGHMVAHVRCPEHGTTIAIRYHGPQSNWIRNPGIGLFHISRDGGHVDIYADDRADESLLALTLIGEISTFLLQMRGIPTLHASAVVSNGKGIGFIGQPGQGKSTIAACFMRRGAALLSDDNLPLRIVDGTVVGGPSLPIMKVLDDTAEFGFGAENDLPCIASTIRKKLLVVHDHYGFESTPIPLNAVYILRRYDPLLSKRDDVAITQLSGRESLAVLLAQSAFGSLFEPAEVARFLPIYQKLVQKACVQGLYYPDGFEYPDRVYQHIREDVKDR